MELTDAESHLIALLRHKDAKNFSVEIQAIAGVWCAKFFDHDARVEGNGTGNSFSAAWDDIVRRKLRS